MPVDIDNGFRHTATDLKQLQALPLDAKVAATKHRIQQWIDEYGTDGAYISFSGGKDSTVLLYIVREMMGYTQEQIPAVFSNTGLEYAEIQKFAKVHGAEFITPKMRFNEVISTYGYPLISKEVAEAIYYARRIKILLICLNVTKIQIAKLYNFRISIRSGLNFRMQTLHNGLTQYSIFIRRMT